MKFKQLCAAGERYGKLTVLDVVRGPFGPNGYQQNRALVLCDCGQHSAVREGDLKTGNTRSCGCLKQGPHHVIHLGCGSRLYRTWSHMKGRCYAPGDKNYCNYGGRGIAVCDEWRYSFEVFRDWALAHGYTDELTLDRIDVNGNYEPSNCRFATMLTQANNSRKNRRFSAFGEEKTLAQWSVDSRCAVAYATLKKRIYKGWPAEAALTRESSPLRFMP